MGISGQYMIAIEHPSKSQALYLPIHAGNALQKFGFEIQSQSEVRVRKPKNSKWPPGGEPIKVKCNYIWANVIKFSQM